MSKKILLVIAPLVAALLASAGTVAAVRYLPLPWTNNIYHVSSPEDYSDTVSVFDDGDNKCYVVVSGWNRQTSNAISCVRMK